MRRLISKIAILAILLIGGQIIIVTFFPAPPTELLNFPELTDLNNALKSNRELLYFGDSTNEFLKRDTDRRFLAEALQDDLPKSLTMGAICHAGYSGPIFAAFARYICRQSSRPKIIIFPVNFSLFSPCVADNPRCQFTDEKLILTATRWSDVWRRPLAAFHYYSPIPIYKFDRLPIYDGDNRVGRVMDYEYRNYKAHRTKKNLADLTTYLLMYRVPRSHPSLRGLIQAGTLLSKAGIHVLFYITPVNYQQGDELLGPRFSSRMAENRRTVTEELTSRGLPVIDMTFDLDSSNFSDFYPSVHLIDKGRAHVAARLSKEVMEDS